MRPSRAFLSVAVSWLAITGCGAAPPAPDVAAIRRTLDSMHVEHTSAYLREDLDAVMAIYTDDPVIRSNHVDPLRGRTALRDFLGGWFAAMEFQNLTYTTDGLAVHGDSAYAIGTFEATVVPQGAEPVTDRGSYMVLFIRDATGAWRSHRGVFNSSLPLPTQ